MPPSASPVFAVGQAVRARRVTGHRVVRSGRADQSMGHSVRRGVELVQAWRCAVVVAVAPHRFNAVTVRFRDGVEQSFSVRSNGQHAGLRAKAVA